MKKLFTFLYPFSYLHTKWWHRLILVIVILGGLALAIWSSWFFVYWGNIPTWSNSCTIDIVNSKKHSTVYLSKSDEYQWRCNEYRVTQYLSEGNWSILRSSPHFNEFSQYFLNSKNQNDSFFLWSISEDSVEWLEERSVIELEIESNIFILGWLGVIWSGLGIFIGTISFFFAVIYRVVIFVIYGSKNK